MRQQDPKKRIQNFNEVALGLTEEEAIEEAKRCLNCPDATCIEGCPIHIDIRKFIQLIKKKKHKEAFSTIRKDNLLPAVCGRVCPQEQQCEKACILYKKGQPIKIGYLERFVADRLMKNQQEQTFKPDKEKNKNVAIVGSGPSGLTCANELRKSGFKVTIFEALHKPGGVLIYGIPSFRLPNEIVENEIRNLKMMGVEIKTNAVIGRLKTIDQLLKKEFDAVYLAVGAGHPRFMGIEGENLNYVYSANEFLTRVNLMEAYKFPQADTPIKIGKKVAVIGGGNTAMDAARTALRMATKKVYCIYRRTKKEMPAREEEIRHAEEEGIEFIFLASPVRYIGNKDNQVEKAELVRMKLGKPDESGRAHPEPIRGSEFTIEVDSVIIAIGTVANPLITQTDKDIKTNKSGYIKTDSKGRTTKKRVYAGGDIVTGSATVIEAMAAGKKVARTIAEDLTKEKKALDTK